MKCPYCAYKEDKVVDSRATQEASAIRRRRECLACGKRFTTYEYIEEASLMVIKKDGRREHFDRKKLLAGITKACEKRPVSIERMEDLVTQVERTIQKKYEREVPSAKVGELIMDKLKSIDEVAYVRFASVYRQFKDLGQFMTELQDIIKVGKPKVFRKEKGKRRHG
jgi:transcriptional repressor NrdR